MRCLRYRLMSSLAATVILTTILIAGCDTLGTVEDYSQIPPEQATAHVTLPEVRDARLEFKSMDQFNAFADYLIVNQEPSALDAVEAQLYGFQSLRTETDRLLASATDETATELPGPLRIVEDPVFESLLNRDGEIQIADSVYKITRKHVYSVAAHATAPLLSIPLRAVYSGGDSDDSHLLDGQVNVFEVERLLSVAPAAGGSTATLGAGDCSEYFPNQGRYNYRLRGGSWINNWGIYRSFGSELESQKKKKKGWFRRWKHQQNCMG